MIFLITLTGDNTTRKEDIGSNLKLEIILDDIWERIKQYDRIYVYSVLEIPVVVGDAHKWQELILRSHYQTANVEISGDSRMVTQNGYYEGTCSDPEKIKVDCTIWRYNMTSQNEVRG